MCIHGIIASQKHFQAKESDIILSTFPKSGTTWLKALTFSIVNRSRYAFENSPLLTTSPHQLVPFLEFELSLNNNQLPNLENFPTPGIFSTHAAYTSLPSSILDAKSRIVYIGRNPLDQFISEWHFIPRLQDLEPSELDESFERTCNGVQCFGPIWDHALGYWKASLEQPDKVLFLKYEDLKENIVFYITKLADFLGYPLTKEEEKQGVMDEISKLCSFDNIKDLEVSKTRKQPVGNKNFLYFRKGRVGDWKNYLTPSMSERIEEITEEKLAGTGLTFKTS